MSHGERVDLGIRSEHVRLGAGGIPATVRIVQPIGPETHVIVGWDDIPQTLTARVPGIVRLQPGASVEVTLDDSQMLYFDPETGRRLVTAGK